jgi:hypothetical protein
MLDLSEKTMFTNANYIRARHYVEHVFKKENIKLNYQDILTYIKNNPKFPLVYPKVTPERLAAQIRHVYLMEMEQ